MSLVNIWLVIHTAWLRRVHLVEEIMEEDYRRFDLLLMITIASSILALLSAIA
jgi:hypothetical protein